MSEKNKLSSKDFISKIKNHIDESNKIDVTTNDVYNLFPDVNKKTISWKLYEAVEQKEIYRINQGAYSMRTNDYNHAIGYEYIGEKAKAVFDLLQNYSYTFYISGFDALIGELLHMPEDYPILLYVEKKYINDIMQLLERKWLVFIENDIKKLDNSNLLSKLDIILMKTKDKYHINHIATKEKAFVDLYYVMTRLKYPISVNEVYTIYSNLKRNKSITSTLLNKAAKEHRVDIEMAWLDTFTSLPPKTIDFMKVVMESMNEYN